MIRNCFVEKIMDKKLKNDGNLHSCKPEVIGEDDIPLESLGFLQGAEYIPLYWGDIGRSVTSLVSWTTYLKTEKEKSENLKTLAMVVLGGLFLWGLSQQK